MWWVGGASAFACESSTRGTLAACEGLLCSSPWPYAPRPRSNGRKSAVSTNPGRAGGGMAVRWKKTRCVLSYSASTMPALAEWRLLRFTV